jgi:valyl-tRNA synthetase
MTSFFEKGNRPLEIVSSRQWYIRNGGTDPELKSALLERGRQLSFYPEFMRGRYDNWVQGLNSDWLVSRQRFFGVPIPLWYPIDNHGQIDYQHPLTAEFDTLPIDPSTTAPPGYTEAQRGQVGGLAADPDVMDTWATSSLTPQIAGLWGINPQLFRQVYPMNLRPQGQDIIRTWLFSTMVRSHTLENTLPWQTAAISGFILDPDRKKMSKSKGNAQTPLEFLQRYSSDGVRYWAGLAKLGQDATLDEAVMKVGRRLAIKILNASKFVLENAYIESATPQSADNPLDQWLIANLVTVITEADHHLANYEHANALEAIEGFFWTFCDDYIELAKSRAYRGDLSARHTLTWALTIILKLFAPFLPFVTSEVNAWIDPDSDLANQAYPDSSLYTDIATLEFNLFEEVTEILGKLRSIRSLAKRSFKVPLASVKLALSPTLLIAAHAVQADLLTALNCQSLSFQVDSMDSGIEILNYQFAED